ncbi:MAG: DUF192 domain-containing protein [Actinomycetota bacterium]
MRRLLLLLVVCLVAVGCGYGDESEPSSGAGEGGDFPRGQLLIDTGGDSMLIDVEIADTEARRSMGLMNRESLPDDAGMVFVFFEEHSGGFWMKDTRIPLSIAFFDEEGEIVEMLDMDPCSEDPCKVYDPGVGYRGALEVNQGAFERWGVSPGDSVNLLPRS